MKFLQKNKEIRAIKAQLKHEDKINGVVFSQRFHEGEPVSLKKYAKILHAQGFTPKPLDQIKPDGLMQNMLDIWRKDDEKGE